MNSQNQFHKPFLSGVLMQVVYAYKKHLAIIAALVIVLSVIFSGPYFITPLFKSTVILYPTASNSISKVLLSDNFNNTKDILEFGEIEQTEQMLQVLNSNKIRDRIISKYNLLYHYNIDNDYNDFFKEEYPILANSPVWTDNSQNCDLAIIPEVYKIKNYNFG